MEILIHLEPGRWVAQHESVLDHRWTVAIALLLIACHAAPPATAAPTAIAGDVPKSSRGCITPVAHRESEAGCFLTTEATLGAVGGAPLFWHLYTYPTGDAARQMSGTRSTVVEAFGRHWVYTIADANWHPSKGTRVAVLGPMAVQEGVEYTARYMEAVFPPDFRTAAVGHRHSGAEAFYVLEGAQCLETPDSAIIARAGEGSVVPSGPPMSINVHGPVTRKAVVLVLHPTAEPWVTPATDWTPQGKCGR